jgi:hypothetical protein
MSSASTTVFGATTIPLGSYNFKDVGAGKPIALVVVVESAFASSGSATETFSLVGHTGADLATGTPIVLCSTAAIPYDSLTAGKVIVLPMPAGILEITQLTLDYLGMKCVTAGATSTVGACSAFIAFDW